MSSFNLSRFLITGTPHSGMPLCVIKEISLAHGVNDSDDKEQLVSMLNETKTHTINLRQLTSKDYQYIARFVNNNAKWNKKSLIKAFNFMVTFINKSVEIDKNFIIGQQDPSNIYNINASILYSLCITHNINTNCNTTIEEMENKIRMLFLDHSILLNYVKVNLHKIDKSSLINFLEPGALQSPKKCDVNVYPNNDYEIDIITKKYNYLSSKIELQERFISTDHNESIILAIINCGINLSHSMYPLIDYENIMKCGRSNFIPQDEWFTYWYYKNPDLFDIFKTFCPIVPLKYYKSGELFDMCLSEGFFKKDCFNPDSCYELLQIAKIGNNFYDSIRPGLKSQTTSILMINIDDVDDGELFFYGVDGVSLEAITLDELLNWFEYCNDFTDPFDPSEIITTRCIRKLKYILSKKIYYSKDVLINRKNLLNIIISIELRFNQTDEVTSKFIDFHIKSSEEHKKKHLNLITILLELGMYLRGWPGHGEYSLKGVKLIGKFVELNSENIWNQTLLYEQESAKLGEFGEIVQDLPLIYYKSGKYMRSLNKEQGLTIKDRIDIFKEGSKSTNINSCTKMSSNWIVWSSYKYLTLMGSKPNFEIYNLEYIEE